MNRVLMNPVRMKKGRRHSRAPLFRFVVFFVRGFARDAGAQFVGTAVPLSRARPSIAGL